MQNTSHEICTRFTLSCVLLWFDTGWFYPYPLGLLYWHWSHHTSVQLDGSVQDCSNSIANALELQQSCAKPSSSCSGVCYCGLAHVDYTHILQDYSTGIGAGNMWLMVAPVPVKQPWRTWVSKSQDSTGNWQYNHNKTKHKTVCKCHVIYYRVKATQEYF